MRKNYDESVKAKYNLSLPYIPGHPYRILIFGDLEWSKTRCYWTQQNINDQMLTKIFYISKIHLNQRNSYLSTKKKSKELKKNSQGIYWLFTSNWCMFKKIYKTRIQQRKKALIIFDDMIADLEADKTLKPIVTGFLMRWRKLKISIAFLSQFLLCLWQWD